MSNQIRFNTTCLQRDVRCHHWGKFRFHLRGLFRALTLS